MTITYSKELQERMQNLHELEVEGTRPFVKRDGKNFLRFDCLRITVGTGSAQVEFSLQGVPLFYQKLPGVVDGDIITLAGLNGEMEYRTV